MPRVSKRELCTIMPGDDSFEEKVRALIDPEYSGQLKEVAHSEINQPNLLEPEAAAKKTFAPISISLNMNQSSDSPNAEWWLSDNRSASRKMANRPIGAPQKLPYKPELSGRVDHYNQQKEECQRKVINVLGPNANNDVTVPSAIETKSDQIQYYLEKVSRLLNDSEGVDKEAPQINDILKNFQVKHNVDAQGSPARRENNKEYLTFANNSNSIPQTSRQINSRTNERTAPLLDSTYSNLDYNKLYAR